MEIKVISFMLLPWFRLDHLNVLNILGGTVILVVIGLPSPPGLHPFLLSLPSLLLPIFRGDLVFSCMCCLCEMVVSRKHREALVIAVLLRVCLCSCLSLQRGLHSSDCVLHLRCLYSRSGEKVGI